MDPLIGLFEEGEMPESLPPEIEEGNVEYKLKLVSPSESRFEHLVTQMKWRLQEGQGEAIYEIGVEDTGLLTGLTPAELQRSIETLHRMATRLGATISVLREKQVETSGELVRHVAEILVRKVPENQQFIDLRLAVLGNVDAGKSTLLGVLTQGELDNGRGRARLNLFRHLHEIQSGRTSSISHEILGFNSHGEVVNYSESRTVEEICENSTKLITLIDLCGHHKYLKTTIFGLTGYSPDFAMLVVSANTGVVGTTKEHLGFALALGVPIFVVVSKTDMCRRTQVTRTVRQLELILKSPGCKKVPFRVESYDDAVTAGSSFHNDRNKFRLRLARSREKLLESLGVRKSSSGSSGSSGSPSPEKPLSSNPSSTPSLPPPAQSSDSDSAVLPLSLSLSQHMVAAVGCCSKQRANPEVAMATEPSGACGGSEPLTEDIDLVSIATSAADTVEESICPIFTISSVTGANIDLLTKFLNVLPPLHSTKERESNMQELSEHQVDEVYYIQGVGVVAWGNTLRGTIKEGEHLLLGPTEDGEFHSVTIHSIHRNRLPCRVVTAGQSACLSLGNFDLCPLRKGMVLVSPELNPCSCLEFEADIYVLFHTHYICKGFQTVIHVGNVMQTATILRIDKKGELNVESESESKSTTESKETDPDGSLQTNEKAVVLFRFINRPEYIRVGSRLLFREGKTKGMGEVTKIYPVVNADR